MLKTTICLQIHVLKMKVDVVKLGKQTLSHTKHVILLKCRYHEQAKHQKAF